MHAGQRVVFVIPALNEEASVAEVVRGCRARPATDLVLLVDNGSHDHTAERARREGAVVVTEARPGYGVSLRTGIERALGLGAGIVVLTEADGTFDPSELEHLLEALGGADLALGSRANCLPALLGWGNRTLARLLRALWAPHACPLTDVGCTYRAFRAEAWSQIGAERSPPGPEFSPWMIGAAFRARLRVHEVPVRYGTRSDGRSKHSGSPWAIARTAFRMLRSILVQRFAWRG